MQITLDEGYQFGLGVFETVALECGRPVFLDWHLERLGVSLKELGISRSITEGEVQDYLTSIKEGEGAQAFLDHGALKIMVSEKKPFYHARKSLHTREAKERLSSGIQQRIPERDLTPCAPQDHELRRLHHGEAQGSVLGCGRADFSKQPRRDL